MSGLDGIDDGDPSGQNESMTGEDTWPESDGSTVPATAVSVERAGPDRIRYDLALSELSRANRLWVVVGGAATVEDAPGFERSSDGERTRLRWTGERPATVSLSVAVSGAEAGDNAAETDDWAFGRVPFVEVQAAANGSVARSWPLLDRGSAFVGPDHVVGERYGLVGDFRVEQPTVRGQTVRLVVPGDADPAAATGAVFDALTAASWRLDVGDRDESVLAFAVPDPARGGGESVPARDEFWVNADSRLDDPNSVWLHEYVHTRQSFDLAPDMRWFREASAEYYAARLSQQAGLVDRDAVVSHLDGSASTATLTDPNTWEGGSVPREKGARALAVLDRKIRAASYGHSSLQDVFRRLNRHDGAVTYDVFARTVAAVAGQPMDAWLDRHVAGDRPVADQYGSDSPLSVVVGPVDLMDSGTGGPFFVVAVAFSLAASGPLYAALRRLERSEARRSEATGRTDGAETNDGADRNDSADGGVSPRSAG